jgi:hypothetical protein
MPENKCPICHGHHDETRTLSFDGMGINSCGGYASAS